MRMIILAEMLLRGHGLKILFVTEENLKQVSSELIKYGNVYSGILCNGGNVADPMEDMTEKHTHSSSGKIHRKQREFSPRSIAHDLMKKKEVVYFAPWVLQGDLTCKALDLT